MSGYRHSGMSREDYEAREKLYDMAVFIEGRWPGQHPQLCRDLRDLGDAVSEESQHEEPQQCGFVHDQWLDGIYRAPRRCTAKAGHTTGGYAYDHGPWESVPEPDGRPTA